MWSISSCCRCWSLLARYAADGRRRDAQIALCPRSAISVADDVADFAFGIAFQLPDPDAAGRIGIITFKAAPEKRRYFIVIAFIIAAS